MYIFSQAGQNGSIYVPITDGDGASALGLLFNSPGATCYYLRPLGSPVAITLATLANAQAAHADGGFVEVDDTNMPGLYRLDLPDAVIASGENWVIVSIGFTGTAVTHSMVMLDPHPSVISGACVDDVANSASTFETDLTETADDAFVGAWLLWRTGALAGEVRQITDYVGSTKFPTVSPAFSAEPTAGDEFLIVNR